MTESRENICHRQAGPKERREVGLSHTLSFFFKIQQGRSEWVGGQVGGQEEARRATPLELSLLMKAWGMGVRVFSTTYFRGVLYQAQFMPTGHLVSDTRVIPYSEEAGSVLASRS